MVPELRKRGPGAVLISSYARYVPDCSTSPNLYQGGNIELADALQVLYDFIHTSGPDAGDAAQAWLDWMLRADPVG